MRLTMEAKRFVVFSDSPDDCVTTRTEFGIGAKAITCYVRKEFPDLKEAKHFADSNEARLGPLKILDRQTDQVVYVSRAGRFAGSLTGRGKPPWAVNQNVGAGRLRPPVEHGFGNREQRLHIARSKAPSSEVRHEGKVWCLPDVRPSCVQS